MKKIKKALSLLLALCLMAALPVSVSAASITVGQAQAVHVIDDETPVVFQFVPQISGHYTFYSYNSQGYDPYGYIMDANKVLLADGDDTQSSMDFSISCYMTAGNTYYLAATCYSGSARYTVQIRSLISPTSMAFDQSAYQGTIGGTLFPQINFYPADCAQEKITLSSSDELVVSIGEWDEFCFGLPGTATVTATSESGLTATCTVTVAAPAELPLNTPWTLDAAKGEQYLRFTAPADGWYGIRSAGDEIDPYVEVLDAQLEGIVQDDETLPDDNFFAPFYLKAGQLCYFAISAPDCETGTATITLQPLFAATSVVLPYDSMTAYANTLCWLTPVYAPQVSIPEALTWHSSNEDVVYVDQLGHASFLESGKAVITVTTETGRTDSVEVTVVQPPSGTDLVDWGICGPDLRWQLSSNGTLTVSGSGEMYRLYDNNSHWDDHSSKIKNVILPDGITSIGYGAFLDCSGLTEILIPDTVTRIEAHAFRNCDNLSWVTLPQQLERLGHSAFDSCISLEHIFLPDGLKRLPNGAFRDCISLYRISLPDSLVSIGDQALSGCPIQSIELPDTLKTIGYGAFAGSVLSEILLPEGLTELRDFSFVNCQLEDLTVPATVTWLGSGFAAGNPLKTLRFLGDAPAFAEDALEGLTLSACYPAANRSWTEAVRQNYGGAVTWIPEGDPGVTLQGTGPDGITLTLFRGTEQLETLTIENGCYAFSNLLPGIYTLTATAANRVTRSYTLTVGNTDLSCNITLHLIGDVDGNGKVNIGDVAKINAHVKGSALLTDPYWLECANVNGGKLNIGDSASLYAHIRGTKKLY